MNTATELMRRALDALHFDLSAKESAKVAEEIRAFLAAEEERKPKFIRKKVCWNCGWPIQETRPEPARKPMTEEEINRELPFECSGIYFDGFRDGIDFAEKHHGISSSIPSLNDTINADSDEVRPLWLKKNETLGWRGYFDVRGFDRMYGDVFDSEEECMARTPTATGYQRIVIELPEEDLIDEEWENEDE